jgi:hypothetical protein
VPERWRTRSSSSRVATATSRATGVAAGAASAVLCPALAASDPRGPELDAWIARIAEAIPGGDAREMAALLEADRAALVVVGVEADAGRIEQTAVEAIRATLTYSGG